MKRILIVEDEQNIREFEVINLRRVGYETVEAGSGERRSKSLTATPRALT